MCLMLDHEILTENGWKLFNNIEKKTVGSNTKNEKIVSFDITTNKIIIEEFDGNIYLKKTNIILYNIKNNYIDTTITEDHKLPYKFNLSDNIKIDTLVTIIYNMTKYNHTIVYLFTGSSILSLADGIIIPSASEGIITPIEINKTDFIKKRNDIEVFSFITKQKTFYVKRNGLEYWTSY
jgi:hypothetical protein